MTVHKADPSGRIDGPWTKTSGGKGGWAWQRCVVLVVSVVFVHFGLWSYSKGPSGICANESFDWSTATWDEFVRQVESYVWSIVVVLYSPKKKRTVPLFLNQFVLHVGPKFREYELCVSRPWASFSRNKKRIINTPVYYVVMRGCPMLLKEGPRVCEASPVIVNVRQTRPMLQPTWFAP